MSQYRSNRGSMVRRRADYSNRPPLQNVVGMIDQLVVAQRGKSTPGEDYAEIYLVHSIPELGLTAEFDENNAPLTKIKVRMPEPKGGAEGRRDILGLTQKKAGGPAMGQGSLVVFEKAWLKNGELHAHYSRGGPTAEDQEKGLKNLYSNIFVCVLPERSYKQQDGTIAPAGRQEVMIADQEGAAVVSNDEELREALTAIMESTTIGTAGFQLHCRQLADESLSDEEKLAFAANPETRQSGFAVAKPKLVGEGENREWVPVTIDEVLDKFWESFPDLAKCWGQPGFQFEFVPMMAVSQAQTLVPSSKKNDKGRDNSRIYALYDAIENDGTIGVFDYGWAMSHAIVERMAEDSDFWYSTYQNPVSTRAQMFALPDIPTPYMPDYHLAAVQAEAQRLGENKKAFFDAQRAAQENAPGEEQGGPAPR